MINFIIRVKIWYYLLGVSHIFCIATVRKVMTKKRNEFKKTSGDVDKQSDLLDDIAEFDN